MPRPSPGVPLGSADRHYRSRIPVYFFVEGETEEDYIRHLRQRTTRFQFFIEVRHPDRKQLVQRAIAHRRRELRKGANPRKPDDGPRTWCIFDYDGDDRVDSLLREAAKDGVRVAFSHPCLELWWLLHFQLVTGQLDTDTIVAKLRGLKETVAFRNLNKSNKRLILARWESLRERYPQARANAEKLVDHCECACSPPRHGDNCVPSKRTPSCNMADLIESLNITY